MFFFLGFDPFHETQKGLADLLESEAAEAQQQAKVSHSDIALVGYLTGWCSGLVPQP